MAAAGVVGSRLLGKALESRYPPPGRLVSIGPGKLHIYCMGAGSPVALIEPGIGVDWSGWYRVAPKLAEITEVCVYDRGGYGWSDAGTRPRDAVQLAGELHALLCAGGIAGPYILVAHSFGGYVARLYASHYGDSLAGMVLADPQNEDEPPAPDYWWRNVERRLPPVEIQRLPRLIRGPTALPAELRSAPDAFQRRYLFGASTRQLRAERDELAALPKTEAEVRAARFPNNVALTVISANHIISPHEYYPPPAPEPLPMHRVLHAKLAAQSARGKLVAAENSGHLIQLDQPELIVEAVRELVSGYRTKK